MLLKMPEQGYDPGPDEEDQTFPTGPDIVRNRPKSGDGAAISGSSMLGIAAETNRATGR